MCIYKYFVFFFNKAGALINRFEYLRYPEIGYAETFRSEHFRSVSSYRSESVCRLISYVLFEMQYLISFCGQLSILHFCISFDLIFHNICFLQRKHDLIKFHNIESSFCCFSCYYGFALVSKRAWSSLRVGVGVGVCESIMCECLVCVSEFIIIFLKMLKLFYSFKIMFNFWVSSTPFVRIANALCFTLLLLYLIYVIFIFRFIFKQR